MSLFRKKVNAEDLGYNLIYEIGKYGKGAEKALAVMLDSTASAGDVDSRLRDAGVAGAGRFRYQLVFTLVVGELLLQSMQEQTVNRIRQGFIEGFPDLAKELAEILSVNPSTEINPQHHLADIGTLIGSNSHFRAENRSSYFPEGDPVSDLSVFANLCDYIVEHALLDSAQLVRNLSDSAKRDRFIRTLGLTMGAALNECRVIFKGLKPT